MSIYLRFDMCAYIYSVKMKLYLRTVSNEFREET